MDEGRQKDLQLLEEIIDKGLKQKLVHITASRYSNLSPFHFHAQILNWVYDVKVYVEFFLVGLC